MTSRPAVRTPVAGPDAVRQVFDASDAQLETFKTYAALLQKWQNAVNLVSPGSLDDIWQRHFADSVQLAGLIRPGSTCLDFGSGAGFPGMVIAIALRDKGVAVHLVESNARKCAFLRDVARRTGTPVEIHVGRVEEIAAKGTVPSVDFIMTRGVAPLTKLIDLSEPFFQSGTVGLFPKGRRVEKEIREARESWTFAAQDHASATEPDGRILEIRHPERLEGRT